jgi:glycosyltransferase involved in cell wall biosynthesis
MTTGNCLILVDLQSHSLGGHFKTWMDRTLSEALKYYRSIALYIADDYSRPDAKIVASDDEHRVSVHLIPEIYSSKRRVGDILSVIRNHAGTVHSDFNGAPVFIMWAQQYLERNLIYPPLSTWNPWRRVSSFNGPWGSLTSISSVAFEPASAHPTERAVHDLLLAEASCRGVFLWDSYSAQKFPKKYLYLPNVEEISEDPEWKMPMDRPPKVGSVGQLWGYRCVNLLAELLRFEGEVEGYLAGVARPESYSEEASQMLRNPKAFEFEEGFVEKDSELDARLGNLDAFLVDGRSYKCPSGLGIRAMAMGRPLVSPDSPSWVASLIREHGVGVFWEPGTNALAADLRSWFDSGGSKRAVAAAQMLNDHERLKESYVKMFDRLSGA